MSHIAAFFDIDGTLLPSPSLERRFLAYLKWRGELRASNWLRWPTEFARLIAAGRDTRSATVANKAHLRGVACANMDAWLAWLRRSPLTFYPDALARIEWHRANCHRIFLVSGTLQPLADAVARQLRIFDHGAVTATRLDTASKKWTGRLLGDHISGDAKAVAVLRLARQYDLDLSRSYAYANSFSDADFLDCVAHPAAVNPSARLAQAARARNWPIFRWLMPSGTGTLACPHESERGNTAAEASVPTTADVFRLHVERMALHRP